ncbi:glucose-methanol-choline (gmc) oxidoreductase [Cordyceps javanica]|uniref:Glucose-methanol-choline (Gmc) oxidoreductase n=1 Tax=Cordyceps javanica TaxID=43265 RepID=A0A545V3S9_9HYPO|nr:glucose-methanol-choline (gmc) oxidoreductase [Cordyceps javanica]
MAILQVKDEQDREQLPQKVDRNRRGGWVGTVRDFPEEDNKQPEQDAGKRAVDDAAAPEPDGPQQTQEAKESTGGVVLLLTLDTANYTVSLVEAGTFYEIASSNTTQVPGYNWAAANPTNVGTLGSGYDERRIGYTQVMTFGGGSAANYGGYSRANASAHDRWAEMVKDDLWSWENGYSFYKKSCKFHPTDYIKIDHRFNLSYNGAALMLLAALCTCRFGNYVGESMMGIGKAMAQKGLKHMPGFNNGKLIG